MSYMFYSSITQVCLFLWTKVPQVCSSYNTRHKTLCTVNTVRKKMQHVTHLKETFV